jgi:hypothetical protein
MFEHKRADFHLLPGILSTPRLHIPVFRNLFFGSKKPFLTGFLRISFFSCVFRRNFSQECVFGGVTGIPVFFRFYRIFSQEFLWAGIPVFTQKEGTLLSKIWTKIDIFNLSPKQDLTMMSTAPVLCWCLLA